MFQDVLGVYSAIILHFMLVKHIVIGTGRERLITRGGERDE